MSALAPLSFASAYRSLRPVEKAFVDGYVARIEREAHRNHERVSEALYRPIPADIVKASEGMLDKPLVRAAITERITDIAAQSELTVQRVIKELMAVSFASIADYYEIGNDGELTPAFDKATPEQLSAVQSIKIDESMSRMGPSRKLEIKLHSKLDAIKMLADYMGLLRADNPFYRAETARPATAALPVGTDATAAGEAYGRLING